MLFPTFEDTSPSTFGAHTIGPPSVAADGPGGHPGRAPTRQRRVTSTWARSVPVGFLGAQGLGSGTVRARMARWDDARPDARQHRLGVRNGVQHNQLPDGSEGIGLAFLGVHNMNQMWCDNGNCE